MDYTVNNKRLLKWLRVYCINKRLTENDYSYYLKGYTQLIVNHCIIDYKLGYWLGLIHHITHASETKRPA